MAFKLPYAYGVCCLPAFWCYRDQVQLSVRLFMDVMEIFPVRGVVGFADSVLHFRLVSVQYYRYLVTYHY